MNTFTTKLNLPVKLIRTGIHWSLTDTTGTQIAGNMGEETAFELSVILNTLPGLYAAARRELDIACSLMSLQKGYIKELESGRDQLKHQVNQAAEIITNYEAILRAALDTIDKSS